MDLSHWDVCRTAYHDGFGDECNFAASNLPTWTNTDSAVTAITGYDIGTEEHTYKKAELQTENDTINEEIQILSIDDEEVADNINDLIDNNLSSL